MKPTFPHFTLLRSVRGRLVGAAALMILLNFALTAQEPGTSPVEKQREAMRKLAFFAGHWSGPITIVRGPGEQLRLTQTEDVQYKLDGLVLLVEGKSTGTDGKAQFNALATISFDDATNTYRFRAYNDGHYLDTELAVTGSGFSWDFAAGPAHIVNTMELSSKSEWHETTDVTMGSGPAHRSVEMLLEHKP
jgi:hypothetical protein